MGEIPAGVTSLGEGGRDPGQSGRAALVSQCVCVGAAIDGMLCGIPVHGGLHARIARVGAGQDEGEVLQGNVDHV